MILLAAVVYVAIAFAAGFLVGAFRELVLRPQIGEIPALLIEAPVMLAVSFAAARWTIARFIPASTVRDRVAMGLAAFAMLLGLEIAGSYLLRGLTPATWLAQLSTLRGVISLALYAAFAVMPVLTASSTRRANKAF